jgi:hypothetical protein
VTAPAVGGGCLCGAVRLRATLPANWVAHCHCSMCRRAHGAGFVTWVGFPRDAVAVESGDGLLTRFRSSALATRSFCSRCGSMLLFESGNWPDETHVTLACLDSADGLEPAVHAYWGSRAPWADWSGRALPTLDPPDHS